MANGAISSVFGTAPELAFPIVADSLSSSGGSGNGTPFPPSFDGALANGAIAAGVGDHLCVSCANKNR